MSEVYFEYIKNELNGVIINQDTLDKINKRKIEDGYCDQKSLEIKRRRRELIFYSKMSIQDAYKTLGLELTDSLLEITKTFYAIQFICSGQNPPESLGCDLEFYKRFYIRVKCLKSGWNSLSIESIISKYFPEVKLSATEIQNFYYCLKLYLSNILGQIELPKGRPRLDPVIKKMIREYNTRKTVRTVQEYRNAYKITAGIKMLTSQDISLILESITKNENLSEEKKMHLQTMITRLHSKTG